MCAIAADDAMRPSRPAFWCCSAHLPTHPPSLSVRLAGFVGWLVQQLSLLAQQPLIAGIKKVGGGEGGLGVALGSGAVRCRSMPPHELHYHHCTLPPLPSRTACVRCWRCC